MIDPRGLTLQRWTSEVNLTVARLAAPMTLIGTDWKPWAFALMQVPGVAAYCPPDPRGFSDWQDWAERFVQCVPL